MLLSLPRVTHKLASMTLPPAVEEALGRFREALRARYGDRLVQLKLFGSFASGDAWEESDADVLVLLRGATRADADEVVALADQSGFVGGGFVPISPFVRTPEAFEELRRRELRIAQDIDQEGLAL
jgi:predicted nucleotidyltransferase